MWDADKMAINSDTSGKTNGNWIVFRSMKGIDNLAGTYIGGIMEQKRNQMRGKARSGRQGSGDTKY